MNIASQRPILVVDDDVVSCQLISEILAEHGYDVQWATSAVDALQRVSREEYRLLVTDVFMPGVSGTVLAWQVHQLKPQLPVLLITAFPNRTTEGDARTLGVSLLAKPFVTDALLERVRELIDNGSAQYQNPAGEPQPAPG
jgi:CheY-like chemotaxis protein